MTGAKILFDHALAAALQPGIATEPAAVVAELANRADPIASLLRRDEHEIVWKAMEADFPSIWRLALEGSEVDQSAIDRVAELIRWIFLEAETWPDEPPRHGRLAALLFTARFAAPAGGLWTVVAARGASSALAARLERLVSGMRSTFSTPSDESAPIHEHEIVDALETAERESDWDGILAHWHAIDSLLVLADSLAEAVQALAYLAPDALLRALAGIDRVTTAITILRALPDATIAAATDNPIVQFALMHLAGSPPSTHPYTVEIPAEIFSAFLARTAGDSTLWSSWMQSFNRYPVRYPRLQVPLGLALAELPEPALAAYIASIRLDPADVGSREQVSLALRSFREAAAPGQRHRLWTMAYRRWTSWDIGSGEPKHQLVRIGRSALDYAIVGYAKECLAERELQAEIEAIYERIAGLVLTWYSSVSDYREAWLRAVSWLQPLAHAENITATQDDWLPAGGYYLPFDPGGDSYARIESGWNAALA